MSYMVVNNKSYTLTSSANKPYMKVSNSYVPLTTKTKTGARIEVGSGYRVMEQGSSSNTKYTSSSTTNSKISSTTALTKTSTTTRNTSGTNSAGMSSTSKMMITITSNTTATITNGMASVTSSARSFRYGSGSRSTVSGLITAMKNTLMTEWYNHNVVASKSVISSVSTHSVQTFTTYVNSVVTASTTQAAGTSVTTMQGRGSITLISVTSTGYRTDSPSGQGEAVTIYSGKITYTSTIYSGITNNSTTTVTSGYTGKSSSSTTIWT